jgi:hypothetical protein
MVYHVARSLYGELGSLKRNQRLADDDPRIVDNPKAVKHLEKHNLLIRLDDDEAAAADAAKAASKAETKGKGKKRAPDAE